jgi:hypothetical protein
MRKFLAFVLLAGVAAPALAAADPGDHQGWRSHRDSAQQSNSDDNRSDRSSSNADRPHADRSSRNVEPQPVTRVEPTNNGEARFHGDNRGRFTGGEQTQVQVQTDNGRVRGDYRGRFNGGDGEQAQVQVRGRDTTDSVRNWRGPRVITPNQTDDRAVPVLREQRRDMPRVFRNRVPIVSNTPREGTQPPLRLERRRTDNVVHSDWRNHWRNDNRYDWRHWRDRNRSIFHLGFYYDPFGWGYQQYQIGWRLWPSYYSSRYWINDPWQYRLPYAPPGYVWVRYWDDALLVDTWSGEVVDSIPNFFW